MDEKNVLERPNKIMENSQLKSDYLKVRDVILSCNNEDQLRVGVKMYNLLLRKYDELTERSRNILEQLIGLMRLKYKSKSIQEISNNGEEYVRQLNVSGEEDLQILAPQMKEETEEVFLKEINIGSQIEGNHLEPDEAKELATSNINGISDYYTNPDYCIIAVENKGGDNKTIRISKKDMDNLHKDGKANVDKYNLTYDIKTEATSAGSASVSYVPPFGSSLGGKQQIVRRTFDDVPVTKNGIERQTGLPIGKMFSHNPKPGVLEEDDIEEAVSYADAVGAYDTPGFASSEFMGTKGKKGKAPVNKGITHRKTAYPGGKFVKIKDRCRKFPYCNQSPEAITLYSENKIIKKGNLKIKK
jgi:hypothetical protein